MMAQTPEPSNGTQQSSAYPSFLAENESEIIRQLLQHRFLNTRLESIFPETLDPSAVNRALDVACGIGAWVSDMAHRYPSIQFIGIDKSKYFIEQARGMTWSRHSSNALYIVQDMLHLEEELFIPETFDLINIRFLAGEINSRECSHLLQALLRLCKPGGMVQWLEAELPLTNSLACQQFGMMILDALKTAGRAFAPDSSFLSITSFMTRWLRNAVCRIAHDTPHAIEVSAGTEAHRAFVRQLWAFGTQVQPFLLATGVTTMAEFERVFQQMQKEMRAETFCGLCFLRSVVGVKRRQDDPPEPFRY